MSREKSLPIVYTALVFLLSACATVVNSSDQQAVAKGAERYADDPRLGEKVSNMCFASSVDSFSQNSDDTVVLEVNARRSYLVEVSRSCYNLDHAQSIALDTTSSCASRGDHLIVSDSAFGLSNASGLGPDRCLITGIYEWDEDAAKAVDEATSAEG